MTQHSPEAAPNQPPLNPSGLGSRETVVEATIIPEEQAQGPIFEDVIIEDPQAGPETASSEAPTADPEQEPQTDGPSRAEYLMGAAAAAAYMGARESSRGADAAERSARHAQQGAEAAGVAAKASLLSAQASVDAANATERTADTVSDLRDVVETQGAEHATHLDSIREGIDALHEEQAKTAQAVEAVGTSVTEGAQQIGDRLAQSDQFAEDRHQELLGAHGATVHAVRELIETIRPPRPAEIPMPTISGVRVEDIADEHERARAQREAQLLAEVTAAIIQNRGTINLGFLTRPTSDQVPASAHPQHGETTAGAGAFGLPYHAQNGETPARTSIFGLSAEHASQILSELARRGVVQDIQLQTPRGPVLLSQREVGDRLGDGWVNLSPNIPQGRSAIIDMAPYTELLQQLRSTQPTDEFIYGHERGRGPSTDAQRERAADQAQQELDRDLLEGRDAQGRRNRRGLIDPNKKLARLANETRHTVDRISHTPTSLFVARRAGGRIFKATDIRFDDDEAAALNRELDRLQARNPRIDRERALLNYVSQILGADDKADFRDNKARQEHLSVTNRTHALARVIGELMEAHANGGTPRERRQQRREARRRP
jgi:hypothetical protein